MKNKLLIYTFFAYMPVSVIATFFPLQLKQFGLDETICGFVLSIPFIIALFFQGLWGRFADIKLGHKKTLIICFILCAVLMFLMGRITDSVFFVIAYTVFYFFFIPIQPMSDAISTKSGQNYGRIRLWGTLGFIIISGITGFLAKDNLKVIFLICTFIFVICLCLAFSFPEDKKTENNKTKQTVWLVLKNPRLLLLYAVAVVVNATVSIQGAFFGIYFVNTLGFSTSLLGIQAMLRLVMEIPFLFFADKLAAKINPKIMIFLSVVLTGVRMLIIGVSNNLFVILSSCLILGATYIVIHYYLVKIGAEAAGEEKNGRIQSVNTLMTNLPRIAGTLAGGYFVSAFGYNVLSGFMGVFLIVCSLVLILIPVKYDKIK